MEKYKAKKVKKREFVRPKINYKSQQELVKEVKQKYYEMLQDPMISNCNILTMLSNKYKLPRPTLVTWSKRWEIESDWLPGTFDKLSKSKRMFTDEVENEIADFIKDNYVKPGNYFPDWQFKNIMFQEYNENDSIKRDFHCSPQFIIDFKNRHRFSSRLAHIKRRPDPEPLDENGLSSIEKFFMKVLETIENARLADEPVLNGDETGWVILPPKMKTWAIKGTSNIIINVKDDEHAHISAMCTISIDFQKLPIFFIAKGNSVAAEDSQLGDEIFPNVSTHSVKSFMTTQCFIEYLIFIRSQYPIDKRIHLIVDSYSSHISTASQQKAEELNIELIYIPSGYTDAYQPLDIAVFAVLKSIANAKLRHFLLDNPLTELGMKKSVEFLIESWNEVSVETLQKGWNQYL